MLWVIKEEQQGMNFSVHNAEDMEFRYIENKVSPDKLAILKNYIVWHVERKLIMLNVLMLQSMT